MDLLYFIDYIYEGKNVDKELKKKIEEILKDKKTDFNSIDSDEIKKLCTNISKRSKNMDKNQDESINRFLTGIAKYYRINNECFDGGQREKGNDYIKTLLDNFDKITNWMTDNKGKQISIGDETRKTVKELRKGLISANTNFKKGNKEEADKEITELIKNHEKNKEIIINKYLNKDYKYE